MLCAVALSVGTNNEEMLRAVSMAKEGRTEGRRDLDFGSVEAGIAWSGLGKKERIQDSEHVAGQKWFLNGDRNSSQLCFTWILMPLCFARVGIRSAFSTIFGQTGCKLSKQACICCKMAAKGPASFGTGGVAEWSIAAVLKTVGLHGPGGSNPSPSAI